MQSFLTHFRQLEQKHRTLELQGMQIKAELEVKKKQLASARASTESEFGTSDVAELRALYKRMELENENTIKQFETALNAAETALSLE